MQSHAEAHGYSIVRDYVGHGIGRRMHEDPQIPNYGKPGKGVKIKKGYVFAIEPMVNMGSLHTKTLKDGWTVVTVDGQPSAHSEHTVAITEEGPEVLTLVRFQPGGERKSWRELPRVFARLGNCWNRVLVCKVCQHRQFCVLSVVWRRKRR